jgi:hypothetical protein
VFRARLFTLRQLLFQRCEFHRGNFESKLSSQKTQKTDDYC